MSAADKLLQVPVTESAACEIIRIFFVVDELENTAEISELQAWVVLHPFILKGILAEISPSKIGNAEPFPVSSDGRPTLSMENAVTETQNFRKIIQSYSTLVAPNLKIIFDDPRFGIKDFKFKSTMSMSEFLDPSNKGEFQASKWLAILLVVSALRDADTAEIRKKFQNYTDNQPPGVRKLIQQALDAVASLYLPKAPIPKLDLTASAEINQLQQLSSDSSSSLYNEETAGPDQTSVNKELLRDLEEKYEKNQVALAAALKEIESLKNVEMRRASKSGARDDASAIEIAEKENYKLMKELEELRKEMKDSSKSHLDEIAALKGEIGELSQYQEKYLTQQDQIELLKEKLVGSYELEARNAELEEELTEKVKELVELEHAAQTVQKLKSQVEQTKTALAESETAKLVLEAQLTVCRKELEASNKSNESFQRQIAQLHSQLDRTKGVLSGPNLEGLDTRESASSLKAQVARLTRQLELSAGKTADESLAPSIAELESTVDSLSRTNATLKEKYQELLTSVGSRGGEPPTTSSREAALQRRIGDLEATLKSEQDIHIMEKAVMARSLHRIGLKIKSDQLQQIFKKENQKEDTQKDE